MFSGRRSIALVTALALVILFVAPIIVHGITIPGTVIAFDSAEQTDNGGAPVSSLAWSHTVGSGSNTILLVGIEAVLPARSGVSSVTYGANSLILLVADGPGSSDFVVETFYMLNPPIGTATVNVTFGFTTDAALVGSLSLFNVAGVGNTAVADDGGGKNTIMQLTIPANTGDLVIDAVMTDLGSTLTPGSWSDATARMGEQIDQRHFRCW